MGFLTSSISEAGNYMFNLLLDAFLLLFLFSNIEDITIVVKLFTAIFIMLVTLIRTYYYIKDRIKKDNKSE